MRRLTTLLLVSCFATGSLMASTVPALYQKAKQQFRLHSYADALETLEQIRRDREKPENEAIRTSLAPGLAFYRGACLAALDRAEEALPELEVYLAFEPNASLDPGIYPKKVIAALEEARRAVRERRERPDETGSVAMKYRGFVPPDRDARRDAGEDWAEGPVRVILTSEQKNAFSRLSDPVSRSEFISNFWFSRDPRPDTTENEFRQEFERRVAFADTNLTDGEMRGSLTDRGMVFLLLGPPTYIGRRPIATGEDSSEASGMSRFSRHDVTAATTGLDPRASNLVADRMTGPNNALPSTEQNWREVWHYRRELLPRSVPYQQVDFEFITRAGYGRNVLQRAADALSSIEAARRVAESGQLKASR
ncbi:MAG: GWxTD domain-containing protein [Acidobacteriota bacterium]